jgi:hypothetical protein
MVMFLFSAISLFPVLCGDCSVTYPRTPSRPSIMISLPSILKTVILTAVILFRIGAEAAGSTCYWPDGSPATGLYACTPNNAESACCANGDYCTTTGYCISSSAAFHYRSACTDKSWASSSCPQGCIGGTNSKYPQSDFSFRNSAFYGSL